MSGKMKLRLKGEAFTKQVITEFDTNCVTVSELKIRVQEILQLNDEESVGSIQLSMNGKQALLAEDTELLSHLGFVSGDAIYILGTSGTRAAKSLKLHHDSSLENEQTNPDKPTVLNSLHQQEEASFNATVTMTQNKGDNTEDLDDKCGAIEKHHVPLSDTPDQLIPESFTALIASNSPNLLFESNLEKLACLLHILMIETGFEPQTSESCSDPFCTLPDSWKVTNETLRLNYKTRSQSSSTIVLSSMGPLVIVLGIGSAGKNMSLKLKPKDFVPPVGGKQLKQLSIDFKNEIAFPLYVHTEREANGECPAHLSNMPPEILSNILQRLDFKSICRMAITSRLFQQLASEPRLWKRLVMKYLGVKFSTHPAPNTLNWKQFYKDEYLLEKKQQEVSRAIRAYPTMPRLPQSFFPSPRVYPDGLGGHDFPGIVGGYSDLYPDLRGFGPPGRRLPFHDGGGAGFPRPFNRFRGFPPI
ncbi:F-box only protein 7-like [Daphnia pulicaria]|uniref:F-box only protein 7-like n=1 Tax=Daphnia pulicaria TaxID=35523 RepID=UPI001EEA09DF|nr:F-box only protein 7-like [Daphnia pulicaria]XP_046642030.1 F-box only protein 7-like [Daphnia pulicaria]XP_046642031.1 F-box only protein 7-like [Daphnia pulicaria]